MNQLEEKIGKIWLALSNYYEHVGNLISRVELDGKTTILYGIIGCVCIWVYYVSKTRQKAKYISGESPEKLRSFCLGEIYGGELMLQRLEQFNAAKVNPGVLANTEILLQALLEEEHLDLMKLQQTVAKLEMSGSEDSAVEILQKAVNKARKEKKIHEAYEIEMLLVEMLIYKGDLDNALNCKCLKHEEIKDKRSPLYKAIIYKMQNNREMAQQCWEKFVEVRDPSLNGECYPNRFSEFENLVNNLQKAIADKKKSAQR